MRNLGWVAALATVAMVAPLGAAPVRHAPARRAAVDWTRTVVRTPEGGVRMGNADAKVKLVEYGARTCPTCAAFAIDGAPKLVAGYVATGKVSYEFRDYPVHGALDLGPMLLGDCVPLPRFFPLLQAMMAQQKTLVGRDAQIPDAKGKELEKATPNAVAAYLAEFYGYTDLAVKMGLTRPAAAACLANTKAVDGIVARANAAQTSYKISGTPSFVLGGKLLPNVYSWDALEPVLKTALAAR
ncbi:MULTISPECIES: thioredoxin domain-containing protein [unclassified Sphingomonas]|uniref:DsbA family protein n=1 Tax=unclassified Sphingomonas TaxID=196159 RepID=UPI001F58880D|nr:MULTISPECIES: thioredoxin domain-containing protein [unclassified Sphingomonas]